MDLQRPLQFMAVVLLAAALGACDSDDDGTTGPDVATDASDVGDVPGDVPEETDTTDTTDAEETTDATDAEQEDVAGSAFACGFGGLECDADEMCVAQGQGACIGPEPDENGECAPGCQPTWCGGGTFCLCTFYRCEPIPDGCTGCDCIEQDASWQFCVDCRVEDGGIHLDCPGA